MNLEDFVVINNMKNNKKTNRQIVKPGDIMQIHLRNGKYMYARKFKDDTAFYDYISDTPINNIDILKDKKILFHVGVYRDIVSCGVWPKIGKIPFQNEDESYGDVQCIYDFIGDRFQYYYKGKIYGNPSPKDCYNMDYVAAWDIGDIEERLIHYIEAGEDHPRMWESGSFADYKEPKKAWKDLFDRSIIVDKKKIIEKTGDYYKNKLEKYRKKNSKRGVRS